MEKLNKFIAFLIAFGLMLLLVPQGMVYAADTSTAIQVVLHKLVLPDDGKTVVINNNGNQLDASDLSQSTGLNGVEFSIYDVTTQLQQQLVKGKSVEAAQLALIKTKYELSQLPLIDRVTTETVSGEDGIASFTLTDADQRQAFLIEETKSPANVTTKADQLVLVTPIYNQFGNLMQTVHIYPKNVLKNPPSPPSIPTKNSPSLKGKLPQTSEDLNTSLVVWGIILVIGSALFVFSKKLEYGQDNW